MINKCTITIIVLFHWLVNDVFTPTLQGIINVKFTFKFQRWPLTCCKYAWAHRLMFHLNCRGCASPNHHLVDSRAYDMLSIKIRVEMSWYNDTYVVFIEHITIFWWICCIIVIGIWWLSELGDSIHNSSILCNGSCQRVYSNYPESLWVHETFTGFFLCHQIIHVLNWQLHYVTWHVFVYSQLLRNHPGDQSYWHRHRSKGSWTLSSADNGWAVSDTTGEALKVVRFLFTFYFCLNLDK